VHLYTWNGKREGRRRSRIEKGKTEGKRNEEERNIIVGGSAEGGKIKERMGEEGRKE
jgi:hypothetical protein